ncbi:MAG: Holliday junction branch migration protein RuvA [Candidatus Edwardsbacteria bacterium]
MFSYLCGKLIEKHPTHLILDVQGIGYHISIPLSTYEALSSGGELCKVFTYLYVRENLLQLFGFATPQERELFEILISVSGVGPKLAVAILSGVKVEEFELAIIRGDLKRITAIPGIGKKTAQRLILELKERFATQLPEGKTVMAGERSIFEEAVSALVSLGVNYSNAYQSVQRARERLGEVKGIEELIREALREPK